MSLPLPDACPRIGHRIGCALSLSPYPVRGIRSTRGATTGSMQPSPGGQMAVSCMRRLSRRSWVVRGLMPFEVFTSLTSDCELVLCSSGVAGPAIGLALFIPAVAIELNAANINLLIVAAVLVGFRYPWAWAFIALTKVTPASACFGSRSVASGATSPSRLERRSRSPSALVLLAAGHVAPLLRCPRSRAGQQHLAHLVAAASGRVGRCLGRRNDHRWALIVAVFLALPRWYFLSPVILVGLFPLVQLAGHFRSQQFCRPLAKGCDVSRRRRPPTDAPSSSPPRRSTQPS